ncbi:MULTISPECIES: methyltransferase domain-containing protein [unclassified Roseateles]|uniref:methyltransferase domain-containing protein n=1 Tax=unclassified Roseateles TaxID=2626991 RepID=UPI0006FCBEAC|nr:MULTISPECIES: methyltransferase domain-containing protein [unclassified Roseateles]KQW46666.1 hypothetical protein ASC81_09820 [Pelomonas sp. Root405]KRA73718.1 hypothetical protein ASD88_09820 [Pelomonas sp. Root662]
MRCTICGSQNFVQNHVLWDGLVSEWQLAPHEARYINAQQGTACAHCGANLRSIALADAMRAFLGTDLLLAQVNVQERCANMATLEINEAGTLTPFLRTLPRYTFGAYPEVDMHALPYADGSFDLVLHSDTLEHVQHPVHALRECWRVLRPGGALAFTVPIVVGRMSRSRDGLAPSYHGNPATDTQDYIVHTEFGADAWTHVMQAGFKRVELHTVEFPNAVSMLARKDAGA